MEELLKDINYLPIEQMSVSIGDRGNQYPIIEFKGGRDQSNKYIIEFDISRSPGLNEHMLKKNLSVQQINWIREFLITEFHEKNPEHPEYLYLASELLLLRSITHCIQHCKEYIIRSGEVIHVWRLIDAKPSRTYTNSLNEKLLIMYRQYMDADDFLKVLHRKHKAREGLIKILNSISLKLGNGVYDPLYQVKYLILHFIGIINMRYELS